MEALSESNPFPLEALITEAGEVHRQLVDLGFKRAPILAPFWRRAFGLLESATHANLARL